MLDIRGNQLVICGNRSHMAVAIKLIRYGKKGQPSYRIVAIDKREKRNGPYIEKIGLYNPITNPPQLTINKERYDYWVMKGAELSEGMIKLKKQLNKSFIKQ